MACQADDRPARPRPPPRNGAATAGTCVPSLLVVPQPPTRSTDLSPNVRKRPGISTCAHRSEPPSASSVPPPGEKAIINRTDRVLHTLYLKSLAPFSAIGALIGCAQPLPLGQMK